VAASAPPSSSGPREPSRLGSSEDSEAPRAVAAAPLAVQQAVAGWAAAEEVAAGLPASVLPAADELSRLVVAERPVVQLAAGELFLLAAVEPAVARPAARRLAAGGLSLPAAVAPVAVLPAARRLAAGGLSLPAAVAPVVVQPAADEFSLLVVAGPSVAERLAVVEPSLLAAVGLPVVPLAAGEPFLLAAGLLAAEQVVRSVAGRTAAAELAAVVALLAVGESFPPVAVGPAEWLAVDEPCLLVAVEPVVALAAGEPFLVVGLPAVAPAERLAADESSPPVAGPLVAVLPAAAGRLAVVAPKEAGHRGLGAQPQPGHWLACFLPRSTQAHWKGYSRAAHWLAA
jgi:hypothetical protein